MPLSPSRSYLTIVGGSVAELEVRRSRFVCTLARVDSEEAARAVIEDVRASARDARHHCTAFILAPDSSTGSMATERSNDDGEPSGTAGAPMLEVLRGRGLSDVVAVVTRWFGGTLLGTGGLIRAYGDAVAAAVDTATVVRREPRTLVEVEVDHTDGPRVDNALRRTDPVLLSVTSVDYRATGLVLTLAVAASRRDEIATTIAELTAGRGKLTEVGEDWVDLPH